MTSNQERFDLFAIGEAVVDFISTAMAGSLASATHFQSFVGGQPANLAINLSLLGNKTTLASCVGCDGFGDLIISSLDRYGVSTELMQRTEQAPTSMSIIARHTKTPDFVISRGADARLKFDDRIGQVVTNSRIVHSSAFAFAREPARSAVKKSLELAHKQGCLVTFDPNYHPKIWPDTDELVSQMEEIFKFVNVTKPSLDDCERIFGSRLSPLDCAERFLSWGASVVIITKGSAGVFLATQSGDRFEIHAKGVDVADVTGAGDAFWAGFLSAYLEGSSNLEAACFGQVIAEAKVGVMGPISAMPPRTVLKERAKLVEFSSL